MSVLNSGRQVLCQRQLLACPGDSPADQETQAWILRHLRQHETSAYLRMKNRYNESHSIFVARDISELREGLKKVVIFHDF